MCPQLGDHPNPNPNNRPVQYMKLIENPVYEINPLGCNDIQLILGHIIFPNENHNDQEQENNKEEKL